MMFPRDGREWRPAIRKLDIAQPKLLSCQCASLDFESLLERDWSEKTGGTTVEFRVFRRACISDGEYLTAIRDKGGSLENRL